MRGTHPIAKILALPLASLLVASCGGDPQEPTTPNTVATSTAPTATATATAQVAPAVTPPRADTTLLRRDMLFGNPDKTSVRISPDGKRIAFLAPVEGVMNIWVAPIADVSAAKPVTKEKGRPIRTYNWGYTNDHVVYAQDAAGDENWHIYAVTLATGETKDLTPFDKVAARVAGGSPKIPGRDPRRDERSRPQAARPLQGRPRRREAHPRAEERRRLCRLRHRRRARGEATA